MPCVEGQKQFAIDGLPSDKATWRGILRGLIKENVGRGLPLIHSADEQCGKIKSRRSKAASEEIQLNIPKLGDGFFARLRWRVYKDLVVGPC